MLQFRTHQERYSINTRRVALPRKNLPLKIHLQWKSRSICIHQNFPFHLFFCSSRLYQEKNRNMIKLVFSSQVFKECIVIHPPQGFKTCLRRGFHTLINNASFPSPTDVASHNPPLSRPSKECIVIHPPQGFKTCLLRRGFHTLINNASFPSPTDVASHNSPLSRPSVLIGTCSLLQDLSIHSV